MKWNSLIFIIGFIIAFTAGYFIFSSGSTEDTKSAQTEDTSPEEVEESEGEEEATEDMIVPEDAQALSRNGCLGCHSVESMGIKAGSIGPDISISYSEIEGKHGKDLDSFLQEPTSAVMATVLGDNPIEDDERDQIVEILKEASELAEETQEQDEAS